MKVKQGEKGGHGLLLWSAVVLLLMGCVFRISHQGSGILAEAGKLMGAVALALGLLAGEMYAVRLSGKWRYGIVAGLFCLGAILGAATKEMPGWYLMVYSVSVGLVIGENRNSGWLGVVKSLLPAIVLPLLAFLLKASGMFLLYLWIPVGWRSLAAVQPDGTPGAGCWMYVSAWACCLQRQVCMWVICM